MYYTGGVESVVCPMNEVLQWIGVSLQTPFKVYRLKHLKVLLIGIMYFFTTVDGLK